MPAASGSERSRSFPAHRANTTPHNVPATARTRASVNSCRSSLARDAPSARRTANSRCRRAPRASKRWPTFTHTIISTTAAMAPMRADSVCARRRLPGIWKRPYGVGQQRSRCLRRGPAAVAHLNGERVQFSRCFLRVGAGTQMAEEHQHSRKPSLLRFGRRPKTGLDGRPEIGP